MYMSYASQIVKLAFLSKNVIQNTDNGVEVE